ncbi:MAG: type III pantothenate kinase [Oscillospiraceae bacterium]|nr:type III pantothenate kinase [Oscillospiraceae bacterium]
MLLCIDIGNTHIVLGVMEGERILRTSRIATDRNKTKDEYALLLKGILDLHDMDSGAFKGAIVSSVVPDITAYLAAAAETVTGKKALIVGKGVKTGVNILIDNPAEAGSDLVVAAAGALSKYEPPMILVDLGTATTIFAIDRNGSFRGGAITAGVKLGLNALSGGTSQLPFIRLDAPKKAIGTNTVDSMQSGVVLGAASMIDGMVERFEAELGDRCTIIATGGLAPVIIPNCRREMIVDDDLILRGLNRIWEKNAK